MIIKVEINPRALLYFHDLCKSIRAKTPSKFHPDSLSYFWYKENKSIMLNIGLVKSQGKWEAQKYTITIIVGDSVKTMGLYSSRANILRAFRTSKRIENKTFNFKT